MSQYSFKLPDLGEGIVVSEIVEWHISVGDIISEDQHLVDVMTDKAVVEVTSPVSGVVVSLACDAGIEIPVGSELILIDTSGSVTPVPVEVAEPVAVSQPIASTTPVAQAVSTPVQAINNKQILTSPSVRKHARQQGIDLSLVAGSGASGRINNSDLNNFIANGGAQVSAPVSLQNTAQNPLANNLTTQVKVNGLRKVIAQKMVQSKRNIPHYSYVEEIDLTALEALRKHLNDNRKEGQSKLTILPFIMKALNKVLPDFPHCNAHYNEDDELLTQHSSVHIGIATMTKQGLMVPVVKDTQAIDIWQCAKQLGEVTEVTRAGKAKSQQLSGSTITITSLGAIGGIVTTPIINAPETTIIGINKMQQRPMVIDGNVVIRTMMNLSSSFDHRIVDGYDGALLIQSLKGLLENPGAIFV
jgi:2-oxoisovalerate dehydrogenase E2 component (dihydrolipoyl transacylase)